MRPFRVLVALVLPLLLAGPPLAAQSLDGFALSGEVRHRSELDARFPDTDTRDVHLLRTRLGVAAAPAEGVEVFVQLQDARSFGGDPGAARGTMDADADQIDLHQAYFALDRLFDAPLRLQVGRQELSYGNERLIGTLGWSNVGRTFDAARARWTGEDVAVDLFAARLVSYFERGEDASENLFGVYTTWQLAEGHALDAFLLFDNDTRDVRVADDTEPVLRRFTPGLYLRGRPAPFDYEGEAVYQTGSLGGDDLRAYLVSATAGVTLDAARPVRLAATYTRLSGDDPEEDTYGAFNTLFGTNHKFYGFMDYFLGPFFVDGLQDAYVSVGTRLSERVRLGLDLHHLATTVEVETADGPATTLGQELDLTLGYRYNDALTVVAGASAFRPGDAFFTDETTVWGYVMTSVTF